MAQASAQAATPKSSRWLLWVLVSVIVLLVGIPVLVLGWLGFVPGVSALLGADEPRQLGVQYTPADMQSFENKSGIRFEEATATPAHPQTPETNHAFGSPQRVETTFTQEELSAAINGTALPWLPLKEVQVKLSDRTIELSGLLSADRIPELARLAAGSGYSASDLARVVGYAEKLGPNVPVYIKASGAVEHAQLDLELRAISVGRFNVPPDAVARIAPNGIHRPVKARDNFAVEQATPEEGSLSFTGILPSTIHLKKN